MKQGRTLDEVALDDLLEKLVIKLCQSHKGLGKKHCKFWEEEMKRPRMSLMCWGNGKNASE